MKPYLLLKKLLAFFNLDDELENPELVYQEISKGVVFRGTNLWILIFAIIIASVGLNMNSTAVIIGAMLISPLMGPINGIGYSIATYDFELLQKSLKNFLFAITASLIASTIYFSLSPISTAYSELLARTSPTIYDVLIALLGGLAGIVAISSRQKGNVLPGVAIATALMPPMCTAGYGLATAQWTYFFGALYLFLINTIFIAIASVWISQVLKFPIRGEIPEKRRLRIDRTITLIISIVLLPSIYFGWKLVQQEKFIQKANRYVQNVSRVEGNYLLKHNIDGGERSIQLVFGGLGLSEEQRATVKNKLADFDLREASVVIEQGIALGGDDIPNAEVYRLREELAMLQQKISQKEAQYDSVRLDGADGGRLLQELKSFYPEIRSLSYRTMLSYADSSAVPLQYTLVLLQSRSALSPAERRKIEQWLSNRLGRKVVKVLVETSLSHLSPRERDDTEG